MRRFRLFIACSLDGFIAREDGGIGWLFSDADYGYKKFYGSVGAVMMGRKTFDLAIGFGETYDGKEVYVFSRKTPERNASKTNTPPPRVPQAVFVPDAVPFAKRLHSQNGPDVWVVGGGEVARALLDAGLIDEIIIAIHPIILGKGIPLFQGARKEAKLAHTGTESYPSGLVQMFYSVLRE